MLISPPFLPERGTLGEQAWLDLAMAPPPFDLPETGAPEGSFPLSLGLAWHNGLHLQAPQPAGTYLPVRAIADGRIVFVHPPTPPGPDLDHPLNYNPFKTDTPRPAWTSDGFIVLRHTSEIGAAGTTPTEVTYFSVCMHLSSIAHDPRSKALWKPGDAVYRKEELGAPGWIYGHGGQIHFEICCDEANLQRFMPRAPAWSHSLAPEAPTSEGRTDSVFGSMYVYLPAGTPTSITPPTHHLRAASGASGGASAASDHFPPDTLQQPLWVRITHDRGDAFIDSFDRLGERIGTTHRDPDCEYDLYVTATQRHDSLNDAAKATSSPSGWYELLRFGRNLGPDALPGNVAHWRQIPTATGTVWADLNAPGTHKFSDADFPAVMGWNCFDDDMSPTDQRCDSLRLRMLIRDPRQPESIRDPYALARRLGDAGVRAKLRRAVCRFPSEWERETIVQRYGGLTRDFRPADGDEAGARKWQRFVEHATAITFAGLPAEFLRADWRFHPREFIGHLRKCVWLSNEEFARCIPRKSLSGTISWAMALARSNIHAQTYNLYIRKYCGDSRTRYAHNLAQSYIETGLLRTTTEDGSGKKMIYGPMYGRGYHQLTWAENYRKYGEFKMISDKNGAYKDARITEISMHPKDSNGALVRWYPKYDPDIVSHTTHAGESSGFYWVSKKFRKTENMNRVCDLGLNGNAIGFNSWLVNGGGNGYINRQQFGKYLENILLDAPLLKGTQEFNYPSLTNELTKSFPPSQQVSQDQSEIVDYEIQIP